MWAFLEGWKGLWISNMDRNIHSEKKKKEKKKKKINNNNKIQKTKNKTKEEGNTHGNHVAWDYVKTWFGHDWLMNL